MVSELFYIFPGRWKIVHSEALSSILEIICISLQYLAIVRTPSCFTIFFREGGIFVQRRGFLISVVMVTHILGLGSFIECFG